MNTEHDSKKPAKEAAYWLIALQKEPKDTDLSSEFADWLSSDSRNVEAWSDTLEVYESIGDIEHVSKSQWPRNEARVSASASEAKTPTLQPAKKRSKGKLQVLAIVGAVAACIAFVFSLNTHSAGEVDYRSERGEVKVIKLEDGSAISLGPKSEVAVDFRGGTRQVRLLSGEALFEVAANLGNPFLVEAQGITTTVLGTRFNVRLESGGASIAVEHGRVRVSSSALAEWDQLLTAGQWLWANAEGDSKRGEIEVQEIAAWTKGQLIVRDRNLDDVVEILRRYVDVDIIVDDRQIAERRVTGVYNLADPLEALRALVGAHGGAIRQASSGEIIISSH
ncbi:MAG: FecR domain-containing protein [Verrucomicrobiota bacterium]